MHCSRLQLSKLGKKLLHIIIYTICTETLWKFYHKTWMSVSETPKSRLETISFPGPAVVKAAGLNFRLNICLHGYWLSSDGFKKRQTSTCQAWLQVALGTDHAAIASSCSSQQT